MANLEGAKKNEGTRQSDPRDLGDGLRLTFSLPVIARNHPAVPDDPVLEELRRPVAAHWSKSDSCAHINSGLPLEFYKAIWRKNEQRLQHLEAHPEDRIRIDPGPLTVIIPGSHLICAQSCSVAGDRAIRGSDIDGAIVISPTLVSDEQKKLYAKELEQQGFRVSLDPSNHELFIGFETLEEFAESRREGSGKQTGVKMRPYLVY